MKIERAVLREVPLTLARPFRSSASLVTDRRVLLLTLHAGGLEGWGECVALDGPTYTSETPDTAWDLLTSTLLPGVVGLEVDPAAPQSVLRRSAGLPGHPMARATVEMATWDLAARMEGVSLARMLGGTRTSIPVGVAVGMVPTIEELAEIVAEHLEQGYARVKVKIGRGHDVDVLAGLRDRFPDLALWADANSAYTLADVPLLKELDSLGLELIEEPLAPGALADYARLQEEIGTSVCLDESIASRRDAELALELGSCRVVNLKPGRVGGLAESRAIQDMLVAAEMRVWCGGMLESGVGRAHNVALASLAGFDLPGDISASRRYWARDIVTPEFEVHDGHMAVPTGAGIGVEVDIDRIEALMVRSATFG
jgi:O-succinylbenzoate synthase